MSENEYHADNVYLNTLEDVLQQGVKREDRTGTGTISLFGTQSRYNISESFPLLTTKRIYTKGVFGELIFFLNGFTNNNWLTERNIHIWDEWAAPDGDLGPIYGYQWRYFGAPYMKQHFRDMGATPGGYDQLLQVIQQIKEDPFSRRHIVSAWNPVDLNQMALPPCHTMFQFYVTPDTDGSPKWLSCQLYQRSGDMFLGAPFNIASYSALTYLVADLTGLQPLDFVHTMGDAHIYLNHIDQVKEQINRRDKATTMPTLSITHPQEINTVDLRNPKLFGQYEIENFVVENYNPLPAIKAPIAV